MIDWVKLRRRVLYHFAKFAIIPEKDGDVCGRRSDESLRPFDQRATESIRGNGIDAYPVERAFTHFSA